MRQFTFFATACVLTLGLSTARADSVDWQLDDTAGVSADGPFTPGNSYVQSFTAFVGSSITFNKVQVQMVSTDTFENPAFTAFSPNTSPPATNTWAQAYDDGLVANAAGNGATSLNFSLHFNDRNPVGSYTTTNPLVFDLYMVRDTTVRGFFEEAYDGHAWTSSIPSVHHELSIVPLPSAGWMGLALMGGMVVWQARRKTIAFSLIPSPCI